MSGKYACYIIAFHGVVAKFVIAYILQMIVDVMIASIVMLTGQNEVNS